MEDALRPYEEAVAWYGIICDEARKMLGQAHCERARGDIETVQANPEIREKALTHYQAALAQYDKVLDLLGDDNKKQRQRRQALRSSTALI